MVKENEKASRLEQELSFIPDKRAIVFVNTKRQCDSVFNQLESQGHRWADGAAAPLWWACARVVCGPWCVQKGGWGGLFRWEA